MECANMIGGRGGTYLRRLTGAIKKKICFEMKLIRTNISKYDIIKLTLHLQTKGQGREKVERKKKTSCLANMGDGTAYNL